MTTCVERNGTVDGKKLVQVDNLDDSGDRNDESLKRFKEKSDEVK